MIRDPLLNRREALAKFANGFGMLGLASILADEAKADAAADRKDPMAVRPPMHPAKAKRVIFLFMSGGPSHVDLFDPKPRLAKDNGKPLPFAMPHLERTRTGNLLQTPFKFAKYGRAGAGDQRTLPQPRQAGRQALRRPVDGRRQHQPQRRLPPDEHGRADVLAPEPRLVAHLRARLREIATCPGSS